MRKKLIIINCQLIIGLIILSLVMPIKSYADDASPSADVAQKLKDLQAEIASKAANLKDQVSQKIDNKAFVGVISSKTDSEIDLTLADGSTQKVITNTYTDIQYQSTKLSKSIAVKDSIAALGEIDDKNNMVAKRIVKLSPDNQDVISQVWGKVTTIASTNFVVQTKDGSKLAIYTDGLTNFQMGSKEVDLAHLENNKTVIVVGVKNGKKLNARFVYIIPKSN